MSDPILDLKKTVADTESAALSLGQREWKWVALAAFSIGVLVGVAVAFV